MTRWTSSHPSPSPARLSTPCASLTTRILSVLCRSIPHRPSYSRRRRPVWSRKVIAEQGDFDIIQLSATPQLYFTSLTYTQMAPDHPLDYPDECRQSSATRRKTGNAHRFHCKPCFCGRSAHRTTLSENRGDIERAGSINRGVSKGIKIPVGHVCMHFPTYTFTYIHKRINNQKKKTICQNADAREYDENTQTVSFKTGHPHTPALSF